MSQRAHVSSVLAFGLLVIATSSLGWGASNSAPTPGNSPSVQPAAAGPRRLFCVSCYPPGGIVDSNGFAKIELHHPVADWFPVVLSPTGAWDLAITLAGSPTRVGVFDPRQNQWLEGPRALGVSGTNWGVGDWNSDGHLEYVYLSGQSVRWFDTKTGSDTVLFSAPFVPRRAYVWGKDSSGADLIGLLYQYGDPSYDWSAGHQWFVYQLFTGYQLRTVMGGDVAPHLLDHVPGISKPVIAIYQFWMQIYGGLPVGIGLYQQIRLLDRAWSHDVPFVLPGCSFYLNGIPPFSFWRSEQFGLIESADHSNGVIVWTVTAVDTSSFARPVPIGGHDVRGGWFAIWPHPKANCDRDEFTPPQCFSVAGLDVTGDGDEEAVLPLPNNRGWEIRMPLIGKILDTLEGMPSVQLMNGPITSATSRDLFYVADSGLYIWWGKPSTAPSPAESIGSPAPVMTLRASPNPFNSTVRLDWSSSPGATTLEIFNILGQRVRTYDLSATNASRLSVEWDSRDFAGHPVPSGLYFARLSGSHAPVVTKLVLLK